MTSEEASPAAPWWRPTRWPVAIQWTALVALSMLITLIWGGIGLPAGLLLGPMIGGIVFGVNNVRLTVPRWPYVGAQAVVGAMVAASVTPTIVATLGRDLALFTVVIAATLLGAVALGWMISRLGLLPGATAIYGTSPGAATAMVLLGEAEGADARLIAFMQYSRVLLVALTVALVAHFWLRATGARAPGTPWLAPVHWGNLAAVLVAATLGQQVARWLGIQAWGILGPMVLLSTLHATGWLPIELPRWLLAGAYALLGLHIALSFRGDALLQARKSLPVIFVASACLITFCGLLGWCLTYLAHVDALTAYLATSPGGLDSVAIIAASTPQVDVPFVLALQSVRLVFAIALAPSLARLVVRRSSHLQDLPTS